MKTLTIKQPWASLIIEGYKKYEFRSWKTNYRGEILIHAGKGIDKEAYEKFKDILPLDLPSGKIIGKVKVVDCIKCDEKLREKCLKENFRIYEKSSFENRYAFRLDNVEKFEKYIEAKEKLSFWEFEIL